METDLQQSRCSGNRVRAPSKSDSLLGSHRFFCGYELRTKIRGNGRHGLHRFGSVESREDRLLSHRMKQRERGFRAASFVSEIDSSLHNSWGSIRNDGREQQKFSLLPPPSFILLPHSLPFCSIQILKGGFRVGLLSTMSFSLKVDWTKLAGCALLRFLLDLPRLMT